MLIVEIQLLADKVKRVLEQRLLRLEVLAGEGFAYLEVRKAGYCCWVAQTPKTADAASRTSEVMYEVIPATQSN